MTHTTPPTEPRLTSLSHGGGCGCKIAPGVLANILRGTSGLPVPPELLVGIETADDAAESAYEEEPESTMPDVWPALLVSSP